MVNSSSGGELWDRRCSLCEVVCMYNLHFAKIYYFLVMQTKKEERLQKILEEEEHVNEL